MPKKAKKTKVKKPLTTKVVSDFKKRLPKNHGEWLELCIKLTERAIDGGNNFLIDQLWRLQAELEQWRKENA